VRTTRNGPWTGPDRWLVVILALFCTVIFFSDFVLWMIKTFILPVVAFVSPGAAEAVYEIVRYVADVVPRLWH
jgi:hypothetical protein